MNDSLPANDSQNCRRQRKLRRQTSIWRHRRGASSLELVMTTAIMLPLSGFAFYLGVQALQFIFSVDSALLLAPY